MFLICLSRFPMVFFRFLWYFFYGFMKMNSWVSKRLGWCFTVVLFFWTFCCLLLFFVVSLVLFCFFGFLFRGFDVYVLWGAMF